MLLIFLPASPKGPTAFARVTVHWGKGNNQTFQGLSDIGCELTLVPGDPKRHSGPPIGAGAYGGQVIPGALALVCVHSHSICAGQWGWPRSAAGASCGLSSLCGLSIPWLGPLVPVLRKRPAFLSLITKVHHKDPSPVSQASWQQVLTPYPFRKHDTLSFSSFCLYSRHSLCLVFLFGSVLWNCVVPVFSTNIPCPLVKPFSSTLACNSQANERKSVDGLIHQSWGKRRVLLGVGR